MLLTTEIPVWIEYVKPFVEVLIYVAAPVVAAVVLKLVSDGIRIWQARTGYEMDKNLQDRIRQVVLDGISLAEQRALYAAKLGSGAPGGAKKLYEAVDYSYRKLKDMGIGEIPKDKIEEWVELLLAQVTNYETPTDSTGSSKYRLLSSLSLPKEGTQFFVNGTTPS